MKRFLPLLAAVLLPAAAETLVPPGSGDLSLTIYNKDLAFVHERRQAEVGKGRQKLVYEGVAHSVLSESVIPLFQGLPVRLASTVRTISTIWFRCLRCSVTASEKRSPFSLTAGIPAGFKAHFWLTSLR